MLLRPLIKIHYEKKIKLSEKYFDVPKNKLKIAKMLETYFGKKFKHINAFSVILSKTKLKKEKVLICFNFFLNIFLHFSHFSIYSLIHQSTYPLISLLSLIKTKALSFENQRLLNPNEEPFGISKGWKLFRKIFIKGYFKSDKKEFLKS